MSNYTDGHYKVLTTTGLGLGIVEILKRSVEQQECDGENNNLVCEDNNDIQETNDTHEQQRD